MYELTVFVLTVTRENHSLAFVFSILYRFQGSGVAALLAPDDLTSILHESVFVNPLFELFSTNFEVLVKSCMFPRQTGVQRRLFPFFTSKIAVCSAFFLSDAGVGAS